YNETRESVNVTVVVYSGRSIDVPSPESAFAAAQPVIASTTQPDPTRLILTYTGNKPVLRKGGWVLDATMTTDNAGNSVPRDAIFYRAVNVDDSTAGQLDVELQTPLAAGPTNRTIVVLENAVEVFPKYDINNKSAPMPY